MKGKLYGIGVGPGDPELLTLKAKRIIEEADYLIIPVKMIGEESTAYEIIKAVITIPPERIKEVEFTMNKDKKLREICREKAAHQLMELLDQGKNLAMITLGDVAIYSTYSYVHKIIMGSGYEVEMIPGIPSFCAGASRANISLTEGNEGLGIIPSLRGMKQVEEALDIFDNIVIMKVGSHIEDIYKVLNKRQLVHHATVVSNVGMVDEYVGVLDLNRSYGYFTTMIIKKEV